MVDPNEAMQDDHADPYHEHMSEVSGTGSQQSSVGGEGNGGQGGGTYGGGNGNNGGGYDQQGGYTSEGTQSNPMYYPERSRRPRSASDNERKYRSQSSRESGMRSSGGERQVRVQSPGSRSSYSGSSRSSRRSGASGRSYSSSGTGSYTSGSYVSGESGEYHEHDHRGGAGGQRGERGQRGEKSERVTRAGIESALNAAIGGRDARLHEGNFRYEDNDSVFNVPIEGIARPKKNRDARRNQNFSQRKRQQLQSSEGFVNCL